MNVFDNDSALFTDTTVFGEALTFYAHAGATGVAFNGVVFREAPGLNQDRGLRIKQTIVHVPMALVAAINLTVNQIGVAERPGGTPVKRTVAEILGQAGGMWKLRLA